MKPTILFLLGITTLVFSISVNINGSEIIDPGVLASVPVIAVDNDNNPHVISYATENLDVRYAVKINNSWQPETVDSEGNVGDGHDIVIDESGIPHVSYRDITNGGLKYAKKVNGSWEITSLDIPSSEDEVIVSSSIALDSQGVPHIAYHVQSSATPPEPDYLKYIFWDETFWNTETPEIEGYWPSMDIGASDNSHIFYISNQKIYYTKRTGVLSWSSPELIDSFAVVQTDPREAVDSSGNPHAVYRDSSGNASLKYASWSGTSWNIQVIDTNIGVSDELDFAIKDDKPYVVYGAGDKGTLLATLDNNEWSSEVVDTTSHVCTIAVDNLNRAHIAHTYGVDEGEIIKYALIEAISNDTNDTDNIVGVVINEFVSNPDGDDTGKEWVELYNSGENAVDLTDWTLQGQSLSGTLEAGEWLQIMLSSETLGNVGGIITLLDNNSTTQDEVAYGDATTGVPTASEEGCSAGRYPDGSGNWEQFDNPTPGVSNAGATPSEEGDVVINEFVSNPTGNDAGNEWVELYNSGEGSVDLTNWSLEGQALSGTLGAGDFLQFVLASETLTDSGDTIILLDDSLTAVDEVAYGDATDDAPTAPPEGSSVGRYPDGSDTWETFDIPTPGAENTGPSIPGDTDGNGDVDDLELLVYIEQWSQGLVGDLNLLQAIEYWAE